MQKKSISLNKIIMIIAISILLIVFVKVYKKNNYNEYIRAEYKIGLSEFSRDGNVKFSDDTYSYKIENTDYNDAMFFKTVKVTPNTPYKVTCMIKTQDVQTKSERKDAGAHISIGDTVEKSVNVTGTTDWTKVEFIFNSKNREEIDIGFRLGGYQDNCIGTAWFSDMTIESGLAQEDNEWDFLCLIFDNIDVNVNINSTIQNVKLTLNSDDIYDITSSFDRFGSSIETLSKYKIRANTTVVEVNEPIKTMSYDEENGYYVDSNDIIDILDKFIDEDKYDHIFVAFKAGDVDLKREIIDDWIGLGGMEYRNIGFSNIRIPSESDSYIYKYDSRINTFPEEVFVHEFLHTLERKSEEFGYERPDLHDHEVYGYKSERLVSLKQWYTDYLNCAIKTSDNEYIGLDSRVFTKTPVKQSNFQYSHKLKDFNEPENVIEEMNNFLYKIINMFSKNEESNKQ